MADLKPDVPSPQEPREAVQAWLRHHGLVPATCRSCGLPNGAHKPWCWYGRREIAGAPEPDIAAYWQAIADGITNRSWLLEEKA